MLSKMNTVQRSQRINISRARGFKWETRKRNNFHASSTRLLEIYRKIIKINLQRIVNGDDTHFCVDIDMHLNK